MKKNKEMKKKNEINDDEISNKKEIENININEFYKKIYLGFVNNKIEWNNFSFTKPIFRIIYQKSRKKQKDIVKYSIKYNKNYELVINAYEKIYTNVLFKHNWELTPLIAYNNYYKLFLKEYLQSKENNNIFNDLNHEPADIVIKTDNNRQGKTLLYIGKLFNVYIDDLKKNNNIDDKSNNIISMNYQTSDSYKKSRKEIIYNYKDLIKRNKIKKNYYYKAKTLFKF